MRQAASELVFCDRFGNQILLHGILLSAARKVLSIPGVYQSRKVILWRIAKDRHVYAR